MNDDQLEKARKFFPELLGLGKNPDASNPEYPPDAETMSESELQDAIQEEVESHSPIITTSGESFDIAAAMAASKDPLTGMMRDLKIDDRDLPLAKNYFDYCYKVMGGPLTETPPWARQMWTALMLFGEVCPRCSNRKWFKDIENVPKTFQTHEMISQLQLMEYGICPKCKANKYELYKSGELRVYNELVLVWGQRSGKSTSAAMMASYHIHRFLKLPKLGTLTNSMQSSTPLTYSFISLDLGKAINLLWEPLVEVMKNSTWYQELFKLLDYYGRKYGIELYNRKIEFIKFFHKNVHLMPTHPGWEKLRGATRIGASFDELGLFPLPEVIVNELDVEGEMNLVNNKKMANADQAHRSVSNSLLTVRNLSKDLLAAGNFHIPTGLMLGVSSPTNHRDMVMRLLAQSQTEVGSRTMLGIQLPTWEVHPKINRDDPELEAAFNSNPEDAKRDFGADPPRVYNTYIKTATVERGIFVGGRNTHMLDYDFQASTISARVRKAAPCYNASVLTVDAGHNNNSFTLCSQYFDQKSGQTVTTTVLEVIPSGGRRINFNDMYKNVILPVAKDTHAAIVFADRWNSLELLYRISADIPGIVAKQFTPQRRHFDSARQLLVEQNARFPTPEIPIEDVTSAVIDNYRKFFFGKPVAHLVHQMTTVKDSHVKRPPEKGEGFTDDIFRAWVLGASLIHLPKVQEILQQWQVRIDRTSAPPAVFVGRSGVNIWPGLR